MGLKWERFTLSASMRSPSGTHFAPSNCISCSWLIGVYRVGVVLSLIPGSICKRVAYGILVSEGERRILALRLVI